MLFKNVVKIATAVTEIIMVIIILITMTLFAMKPADTLILTNVLLLIMILGQLFIANILIHIHDRLEGGRRR